MINQIINEMSTQLNIRKGTNELESSWHQRVLYSSIGLNMLAATYDYDDDSLFNSEYNKNSISMQHILKRGMQLSEVYNAIGELKTEKDILENIRELYIKTGYMLHRNNRLTYPLTVYAKVEQVYLTRGQLPWTVTGMSGLGTYMKEMNIGTLKDLTDMFHIEKHDIKKWYHAFESGISWCNIDILPNEVEYINITENTTIGYWVTNPPRKGVTVCRDKRNGERVYKLLRIFDTVESYTLPSWRVDNGEYLRIALALRIKADQTPVLTVKRDDKIAVLFFGYLLPPAEQNFVELYSWPTEKKSRWERIVSIQLLPVFIDLFKRMGYDIREEM